MTTSMIDTDTVALPVTALADAAAALARAGRANLAAELLDAASPASPGGVARIALAAAEVALAADWAERTDRSASRLDAAAEALAAVAPDDPSAAADRWRLQFQVLRRDYRLQLFGEGTSMRFGPAGRDEKDLAAIRATAEALRDHAPTDRERGWAEHYFGLILDTLFGDREAAPAHYEAALGHGEASADGMLIFEALRHLGDHDHDDGRTDAATERWTRAVEAAAHAGAVNATLAQQLHLAVLARERGDEAGAVLLAGEVSRWATAIGAVGLAAQAAGFVAGQDPTAGPDEPAKSDQ